MELCGEWTATHDRMPGRTPTLRVDGCCCFNEDGWQAELRDHEPQGINPRIMMIDLVVTPPDGSVPEVLTEVPVQWEQETGSEYDQVHVVVVGGEAPDKMIDVLDVSQQQG